jgi:hypothetical protein
LYFFPSSSLLLSVLSFFGCFADVITSCYATNYLLIGALCYSIQQNRNNVLEERVVTLQYNVIEESSKIKKLMY